jgi:hypothetical protein
MKRFTAIVLVVLAGFCTAGRLQAQTHEVRATVPFSFIVGGKQLPPGNYRIYPINDVTVVIQNRDHAIAALSLTNTADSTKKEGHLVFNKYGDRYFLSEILSSRAAMNVEIARSKLERQAQTQRASLEPDRILVAAE